MCYHCLIIQHCAYIVDDSSEQHARHQMAQETMKVIASILAWYKNCGILLRHIQLCNQVTEGVIPIQTAPQSQALYTDIGSNGRV